MPDVIEISTVAGQIYRLDPKKSGGGLEGPKVLASPQELMKLKQIFHLLLRNILWVDKIVATVAIFEFPLRILPNFQN